MPDWIASEFKRNLNAICSKKPKGREFQFYLAALIIIGVCLSVFYYLYLRYYNRFYFVHYYEFFADSSVLSYLLKKFYLEDFLNYYALTFPNKILYLINVPLFIVFGQSHLIFFFSGVLLKLGLLAWLFIILKDIFQPQKAFFFCLTLLSSYFFLQLLASFYVDLTYFLVCSLFLIYTYKFSICHNKHHFALIFVVFLLFMVKQTSYLLVPFILIFFIFYCIHTIKEDWLSYVKKFAILILMGFVLYFIIGLQMNAQLIRNDLGIPGSYGDSLAQVTDDSINFNSLIRIINIFRGILDDFFSQDSRTIFSFLFIFPSIWATFLLYGIVIYYFIRKKRENLFWLFIFITSEFFLFFLSVVIVQDITPRFFLPFYFVYYYFLFDFFYQILIKLTKKHSRLIIYLLIIFLFLFNLRNLFEMGRNNEYTDGYLLNEFNQARDTLFDPELIPVNSTISIENSRLYHHFSQGKNCMEGILTISYCNVLSKKDPIFNYHLRYLKKEPNYVNSDFIACFNCEKYVGFSLIKKTNIENIGTLSIYKKNA